MTHEESDHDIKEYDIKWKVADLTVHFEDYEDIKERYDDLDEEIEETTSRRKRNEKKDELKDLKSDMSDIKSTIVKMWKNVRSQLSNVKDIQNISKGDTYFMASVMRIKKDMKELEENE